MEAASLYEIGGQWEKAAEIYIKTKDFTQASKIMGRVTLPKLHALYAKACEQAGKFQEAAAAYKQAHDLDSVTRLCLDQLNQPDRAFSLVRETGSSTGAAMVAQYCQSHDDFRGAIEFLLMASRSLEAFNLAKSHVCMDLYTSVLGDKISPDDALEVAHYYETQNDLGKAGQFYSMCGQYNRALKLFLQCGDKEVDRAIEVVGKARNDMLTHMLIDFLMGETDGQPKDPDYVYRLYMALGNFSEASKTAIIIAQQEQSDGDYARAHKILYNTIHELEQRDTYVPQQLRQMFVVLHSYQLVKKLAKRGDHEGTARLLLRVAKNISKFPKHQVRILISTIIECQKSGLKDSAYEWATYICSNPDFKKELEESKFKNKIQTIIRRPNRDENPEEMSPCPISNQMIPQTELSCPTTKDALPMCIVTGRHMEIDDWCFCPATNLPALYSEYIKYLTAEAPNAIENVEGMVDAMAHKENTEEKKSASGGLKRGGLASFRAAAAKVVKALDPVSAQMVSTIDLKRATHEEAKAYIKKYNTIASASVGEGAGGDKAGGEDGMDENDL
jgi:WD repeat-containing protein 19